MTEFVKPILKYTGEIGPIILFVPTIFLLFNKRNALIYYISGSFLNCILNIFLKLLIKQPRPSDDPDKFELLMERRKHLLLIPYDVFGMPSGHTQSVAFTTVFVFLTIRNDIFRGFCVLIALVTTWQRVEYNYHTVLQVIVGGIVGFLFAFLMFYLNKINIAGLLKEKCDDNAPI
jgi:membrane-associated phospholipid phosphatase